MQATGWGLSSWAPAVGRCGAAAHHSACWHHTRPHQVSAIGGGSGLLRKWAWAVPAGRGGGGAVEGQRPAGGRPLPGGGTCGRSGARGRQRGPAPPCRDCTRRGSGRHAFGRRSRAATSGPSSRPRTRTPPSAGCQPPPPPRPVRASRVEGRKRVPQRQSALSSAMKARSASLPEKKTLSFSAHRLASLRT